MDALRVGNYNDQETFTTWIEREDSARKILQEWVLPVLANLEGPAVIGGMDTIAVDSLDEALTWNVLHGTTKDTIVQYLVEFRTKWPPWIRFLATSRPDSKTKKELRPLARASIDVHRSKYYEAPTEFCQRNLDDVREYVALKLRRITSQSLRLGFEDMVELICSRANGVFMYAHEVLCQLEDYPTLDLESLPPGLTALYMERYMKTFPEDRTSFTEFQKHTKPMLELLIAMLRN